MTHVTPCLLFIHCISNFLQVCVCCAGITVRTASCKAGNRWYAGSRVAYWQMVACKKVLLAVFADTCLESSAATVPAAQAGGNESSQSGQTWLMTA